jgi:hypothetical protein
MQPRSQIPACRRVLIETRSLDALFGKFEKFRLPPVCFRDFEAKLLADFSGSDILLGETAVLSHF